MNLNKINDEMNSKLFSIYVLSTNFQKIKFRYKRRTGLVTVWNKLAAIIDDLSITQRRKLKSRSYGFRGFGYQATRLRVWKNKNLKFSKK